MKHFFRPAQERYESELLPQVYGKSYDPAAGLTLGARAALHTAGTQLVKVDGEALAIHPDTACWSFLSKDEAASFESLDGRSFSSVADELGPTVAQTWISALYGRGLLNVEGIRSVDPTVFHDSPNYDEGNLIELLVTEKCNLACGYCLAGASPSKPAMTEEIGKAAIDKGFAMDEAGTLGFEFAGGEPFLKFELMKTLVSYIQAHAGRDSRKVYLTIQTNGTLLNDERVRWVLDNEIQLGLSIDGGPESQNHSRPLLGGQGSFRRVLAGIDILQRHGVPFGVISILNRSNAGKITELVDFLTDNEIYALRLNPIAYLGTGRDTWNDLGLEQGEVIGCFKELLTMIAENNLPLVESNTLSMLDFLTSKQRKNRCMRTHCGAGDTFQAIAADGTVYPCGRATETPDMALGNVLSESNGSLSSFARNNPLIQLIRERRPTDLEGCQVCPYRQLCQSGCSMQAFERYGTVRHRTPECDFYKTMYPYLMRWLSFDARAFSALRNRGYFGPGVELAELSWGAAQDRNDPVVAALA